MSQTFLNIHKALNVKIKHLRILKTHNNKGNKLYIGDSA